MLRSIRWLSLVLAAALALICAAPALAEETPADYNRNVPQLLHEGHLYADAAVLVDASNGDILFAKNARQRMYPASTTKVMTLLLALESGIGMDTTIVIPKQANEIPADSSLIPVFPGDVMTFRGDLYGQTEQHGNPVDYASYRGLHDIYNVQKKDIFAVWFRKCREVGLRPWISLRMNDCHSPDEAASPLRGELFYTAEANGWTIGGEYGYYRHCFNYAVPEIRQLMLDYTREQLLRYDVYGLELDFMREIYCFDYKKADTGEIVAIMNQYMRDTAAIVKKAAEKWGHEIRLSVRLMRDIDQCYAYGFDPLTWCEEGLVDAITVTPRFSSNDSAMPIAEWKARCPSAEIWAGIETLVNTQAKGCCASAEVARGYGAQYLTAGADGLYLFNYMTAPPGIGAREKEVYDTCGSLAEILKHPRRHVVTYQDICPDGWEPYDPLPLKVKAGAAATLPVETGCIPDGAGVTVLLGFSQELAEEAAVTVTIKETPLTPEGRSEVYGRSEADGSDVPQGYCREDCVIYRYTLNGGAEDLPNLLTLAITNNSGKTVNVTYAEIKIE